MKNRRTMGIYIHIPFCVRKCIYCDFLSFAATDSCMNTYVDSLIQRIKYLSTVYSYPVSSIFIGGGTPSIIDGHRIQAIMDTIYKNYSVLDNIEISIECNPGTVNSDKLGIYKASGINRLSFGLQSTDNSLLRTLGRIHTYEDFLLSYDLARSCGFNNINIDIMSALPNQSLASYESTLNKVISLNPEHISAYSLILEEHTPMYDIDRSILPDEDAEREMYYMTKRMLGESGYHRYEISNYSKEGYECLHNLSYWERINYLGIGLGASSLIDNVRFKEISDLDAYTSSEYTMAKSFDDITVLDTKGSMEEYMFLGLRKTKGISISCFEDTYNIPIYDAYGEVIDKFIDQKLLYRDGDYLALTDYGTDVSNYVMAEFLDPIINYGG